jgi:hypothetical protein
VRRVGVVTHKGRLRPGLLKQRSFVQPSPFPLPQEDAAEGSPAFAAASYFGWPAVKENKLERTGWKSVADGVLDCRRRATATFPSFLSTSGPSVRQRDPQARPWQAGLSDARRPWRRRELRSAMFDCSAARWPTCAGDLLTSRRPGSVRLSGPGLRVTGSELDGHLQGSLGCRFGRGRRGFAG